MRKVKSRRGFTLTETLIAVALLGLLAAGTAVASGSLISVRNGMIATADGEALGSTLLEALTHEVRYGQNITVEQVTSASLSGGTGGSPVDMVNTLDSMTFGVGAKFSVNSDGRVEVKSTSIGSGNTEMLVSESAYTNLRAKGLEMKVEGDKVIISLTITDGSNKDIWSGSVTVTPLNGI